MSSHRSARSTAFRPTNYRAGFTIVEMMVAVALTLLLMMMVVSVMSQVMDSISTSRSTIEMTDRVRHTRERLQRDLGGITLFPNPPHKPENGEGYFEYIEGPMGPTAPATGTLADGIYALGKADEIDVAEPYPAYDFTGADNTTMQHPVDRTVGDLDDIIMFTSRAQDEPFVGRFTAYNPSTNVILDRDGNAYSPASGIPMATMMVESRVAEIAYFVRGTTLYRRVLLVLNGANVAGASVPIPARLPLTDADGNEYRNFYGLYDVTARIESGPFNVTAGASQANARLFANNLSDLTKRENRYAHDQYRWPHESRQWWALGLPILEECSDARWPFPWSNTPLPTGGGNLTPSTWTAGDPPPQIVPNGASGTPLWTALGGRAALTLDPAVPAFDAWRAPDPWQQVDRQTGRLLAYNQGTRFAEDVILTDVLSFDVKVWDPGAPLVPDANGAVHQPGDPAYINTVQTGVTPVGYGAFVDLWGFRELDTNNDGAIETVGPTPPVEYAQVAGAPAPQFLYRGNPNSQMVGGLRGSYPYVPAVYDTWSTHYELDGIDQDNSGTADQGANGLDDDNANGVDDPDEMEAPPPYAHPLRAVQIKMRVFDPDSRQIREVTVVHEFLPQ